MDLKLVPKSNNTIDLELDENEMDFVREQGLQTSVLISLFSDQRSSGERGWWGDVFFNRPIGSKVWTLRREKKNSKALLQIKSFCEEALSWLVEDGIAQAVVVNAEVSGEDSWQFSIDIERHELENESFNFRVLWEAETGKIVVN